MAKKYSNSDLKLLLKCIFIAFDLIYWYKNWILATFFHSILVSRWIYSENKYSESSKLISDDIEWSRILCKWFSNEPSENFGNFRQWANRKSIPNRFCLDFMYCYSSYWILFKFSIDGVACTNIKTSHQIGWITLGEKLGQDVHGKLARISLTINIYGKFYFLLVRKPNRVLIYLSGSILLCIFSIKILKLFMIHNSVFPLGNYVNFQYRAAAP